MRETGSESPLGGFLSNLVTSFQARHKLPDSPAKTAVKWHKMSKYLIYLINSKTTCDCIIWIVLYKELY